MSEYGEQLDLPLSGQGEATCNHTDEFITYVNNSHRFLFT